MPNTHPNPRYRPSADQHQERPGTPYRGRLRIGHADARRHVAGPRRRARRRGRARRREVTRLSAELDRTRLDRANLRAAMRATLAAHADGEPDPMWYLRDELDAPESLPADSRRPR